VEHVVHIMVETLHIAFEALREAAALLVDAADREALSVELLDPGPCVLWGGSWRLQAII
jgi:hypothetical protein